MRVITIDGMKPTVDPTAWVASDVTLVGDVRVGSDSSVYYASVIRADSDSIVIGPGTNIQDGCIIHADPGFPVSVGSGVSIGHRAVLHGCSIEDDVLIGMGATILNGARIGTGSLIAAGAVVLEGMEIPKNSLVAGVPAKVRRMTTQDEQTEIRQNAIDYRRLSQINARGEAEALRVESGLGDST
jgi:carbonic anhydrase/acetyltransferase-like protein (isoleucine patch superfamily)